MWIVVLSIILGISKLDIPMKYIFCLLTICTLTCCSDENVPEVPVEPNPERGFLMGFTSWSFGPNSEDVKDTYDFIGEKWLDSRDRKPMVQLLSEELSSMFGEEVNVEEVEQES